MCNCTEAVVSFGAERDGGKRAPHPKDLTRIDWNEVMAALGTETVIIMRKRSHVLTSLSASSPCAFFQTCEIVPDWPERMRSSATIFSRSVRNLAVAGELGRTRRTSAPATKARPPKRMKICERDGRG
jgi:hypothetical protein